MQGNAVFYTLHKAAHYRIEIVGHEPAQRIFLVHRGALAGAEVSAGLKTSTGVSAAAPWFPLMQSTPKKLQTLLFRCPFLSRPYLNVLT